jgi:hypothetical protein
MDQLKDGWDTVKKFFNGEPNALPSEVKDLFNGYDELGGDVVKYDQTAEYFKTHSNTQVLATAGVMALDKPAPWLFSGKSNASNKVIVEQMVLINAELPLKDLTNDVRAYKLAKIETIVEESLGLVMEDDTVKLGFEGANTLKKDLHRYLPHYSDQEINSFSEEDIMTMKKVRGFWRKEFRTVNVSKLKRVGLMYLQMHGKKNRTIIGDKFIKNKNGRPCKMDKFGKNEDTIKITKKLIDDFKSDKKKWRDHSDIFSSAFTTEMADSDIEMSETQEEFRNSMELIVKLKKMEE